MKIEEQLNSFCRKCEELSENRLRTDLENLRREFDSVKTEHDIVEKKRALSDRKDNIGGGIEQFPWKM